jgi:hypothetical protein
LKRAVAVGIADLTANLTLARAAVGGSVIVRASDRTTCVDLSVRTTVGRTIHSTIDCAIDRGIRAAIGCAIAGCVDCSICASI